MKIFTIQPTYKKSVVNTVSWWKEIDEVRYVLKRESTYRWGEFSIAVPETEEELKLYAEDKGYDSFSELLEDYGYESNTTPEHMLLPDPDDDFVDLTEDFDAMCEDLEDESSVFFFIYRPFADNKEVELTELGNETDFEDELQLEAERIWEESYDEGLEEAGWNFILDDFQITSSVTVELKDD